MARKSLIIGRGEDQCGRGFAFGAIAAYLGEPQVAKSVFHSRSADEAGNYYEIGTGRGRRRGYGGYGDACGRGGPGEQAGDHGEHGGFDAADNHPDQPAAYVAQIPPLPGFHIIAAGGREAICQASDDDWVKAALLNAGPATKPSTMPSDALHYLEIRHDELARELTADLGLSDQKDVNDFLDNTLRPAIEKIGAIKPRVLYMVASLCRSWT